MDIVGHVALEGDERKGKERTGQAALSGLALVQASKGKKSEHLARLEAFALNYPLT